MPDNEIEIRITGRNDSKPAMDAAKKSSEDVASGYDKAGEAADGAEGKARGFADTLTGTSDVMMGAGEIAKGNLFEGFVMAGSGAADLAGGLAQFLIPALSKLSFSNIKAAASSVRATIATKAQTIAQKALNIAMRANPVMLIVTGVLALIAALVLAYKKSETFRRIVNGAFKAVQGAASAAFGWIKSNWPLLLAIITGPFGLAVLVIVKKRDAIVGFFKSVPGKIKGFFSGLGGAISAPFQAAFESIKGWWNDTVGGFGFSVPDWVPKVGGNEFRIPEMAHGGIAGGLISVGERGRELIRVPHGSTVIPNGQTERMLTARGGGGEFAPVVLMLDKKVVWQGLLELKRQRRAGLGLA